MADDDFKWALENEVIKRRPHDMPKPSFPELRAVLFDRIIKAAIPDIGIYAAGPIEGVAQYEKKNDTLKLATGIAGGGIGRAFQDFGIKTPVASFVNLHEIAHQRLFDSEEVTPKGDSSFLKGLREVVNNGSTDGWKEHLPNRWRDTIQVNRETIQMLYQETFADTLSIALNARRFGDDPRRLTEAVIAIRMAKPDDPGHASQLGLDRLRTRLDDDGFRKTFTASTEVAEKAALVVAQTAVATYVESILRTNPEANNVLRPLSPATVACAPPRNLFIEADISQAQCTGKQEDKTKPVNKTGTINLERP